MKKMKKSMLLATAIAAMCSCSESSPTDGPEQEGPTMILEFVTSEKTQTRANAADPGNESLKLGSHVSMAVHQTSGTAAVKFIDSRYLVSEVLDEIAITYNNNITAGTDKQKIIEVSTGTYDFYGVGVNDGMTETEFTLNATELNSTYATQNGKEYIHVAKIGHAVDNQSASTRQIHLSFERQVAMIQFTLEGGNGVNLPAGTTEDLRVKEPRMQLPQYPNPSDATEGVMTLKEGINKPLTGALTPLTPITSNALGEAVGMYYYVLPMQRANPAPYALQFKLRVDDGGGTPVERTFDVQNIPLPTFQAGGTTCHGYERGKRYTYTIRVSNTGAYFSKVQVADWKTVAQPPLDAQ